MKAFLILEDGNVFQGTSIGADKEVISEIVFNTSMTGYLEVLTDPSYAGQAVVMTYPLIGNYGIGRTDSLSVNFHLCRVTSEVKILFSIFLNLTEFRESKESIPEPLRKFFVRKVR